MADMDNFSEINQNFDTIKTLLNSIRAQGILNTSDVDKLLSGINTKLERINTEEDIDLIKIFLSELKQNLDERHGVLVSKFGAIESLFSSLLKNSAEMPKSTDIKELFDIVATNLSVFSREVVSQKDTLTDITLRLDALRSDDSQKKDIIKNITLLKPDLERLNNGFDSIVLSLNDNFKTIIKTITSIDKTEYLDKFSDELKNLEMSSNTVLSALQMLDKKTGQVEDALLNLATKDDVNSTNQRLFDLTAQSHELKAVVSDLSDKYIRVDNLADKIDASVNIIANLKTVLEDADDKRTSSILEQLRGLEAELQTVSSDAKFEEFKLSLEKVLNNLADNMSVFDRNILTSSQEIKRVITILESLEINANFQNMLAALNKVEEGVKSSINEVSQKLATLQDANVTRVLQDISSGADSLSSKLNQTQTEIALLCEKNFGSVSENILDLKKLVAQIDENSVSANNAIFSNITDRLTVFENSLSVSLEEQEKTVNYATAQLVEQIDNIKNLSNILDYKMDSSVVEVANIKREFSTLQTAIEAVLALDFVNTVKDLRVDLYASKQELANTFEATSNDFSEKFSNDLYAKYELLISKLDSVEDEFKKSQMTSLVELKAILEKISSSIVDVISYVSETNASDKEGFDDKIAEIANLLKDNSMNYVENVRDVVDVIRVQVENNLKYIEDENSKKIDLVKRSISENSEDIKNEIKNSYTKLIQIQDLNNEIKELLNVSNLSSIGKIDKVLSSAESVKTDFDTKLSSLKNVLLDKISDFKQEFTCENADKISELKFSVENLYSKNSQEVTSLIEALRSDFKSLTSDDDNSRAATLAKILDNFVAVKDLMRTLNQQTADNLAAKVDYILDDFTAVKTTLEKVDENIDGDLTRQLSILESNFESLVSQITILFDKSDKTLTDKINEEFAVISEKMQEAVLEKLEAYKLKIEETFDGLTSKSIEQSKYLQERIADMSSTLQTVCQEQADLNSQQIEDVATNLRVILDENIKLTAVDYVALKNKLGEFAKSIESNNQVLTQDLKAQLDDMTKYIGSLLDIQTEEADAKYEELLSSVKTEFVHNLAVSEEIKTNSSEQLTVAKSIDTNVLKLAELVANNNTNIENIDSLTRTQHGEAMVKGDAILNTAKLLEKTTSTTAQDVSSVKTDLLSLAQIVSSNKDLLINLETSLSEKMVSLKALTAEISAGELQTLDAYIRQISELLETEKQQVLLCKDMIIEFSKTELDLISKNIEKETDVIIAELIEQFDILKKNQADDIVNLVSRIEDVVNAHIYNNIEDLKSYLDIKTDNSVLTSKLDNLKIEMNSSVSEMLSILNKLLDSEVFKTALSDFRTTNELFITSSIDKLNKKVELFITENGKNFADKLALFDKKFIDTVVDKYEEVKLITNRYNGSFEQIQKSLTEVFSSFETVKSSVNEKIDTLALAVKESAESTNREVRLLNECFENLRTQISNKSFDEAFQASINKQIATLEGLITDQLGYIEDISDLCISNLPEVAELNTLVKHSVLESVKQFSEKLESYNIKEHIDQLGSELTNEFSETIKNQNIAENIDRASNKIVNEISDKLDAQDLSYSLEQARADIIEKIDNKDYSDTIEQTKFEIIESLSQGILKDLNQTKSDIITQFLNVFNQISFITEQEEILDFIQEKHDELITILSHIVTTSADVNLIKDNLAVVDNKIESLKDDIGLINEKITAIISSDGDIDYVYSLQELESDIASLRLALNEFKEENKGKEFEDLIASTNEIYGLVETIKNEFPTKQDFDSIAEDIVSISTRTNKLILASDESYKTLKDNLQDFKLVINDLDERTRNFAEESGMNRIDSKLNAINSMMVNGAKTNQVFNQIFEYLAEWVDNASVQINSISDKVGSLDGIEQIRLMLADMKSEAGDNTETVELIEALGNVFDKQTKRISSLETKLDKIIVETTIHNKNNKIDMAPIEDTLNRFLIVLDDKITSQQAKINSLEAKLESVMSLLDEKDTAMLTKKVGGMDRQIAKLNKSIEKIASHVVEK